MASYNPDHPLPMPPVAQGQQQNYYEQPPQQQHHQQQYYGQALYQYPTQEAPLPQPPVAAQQQFYRGQSQPVLQPPQQAQSQRQERPRPESRRSRAFSFRSDKSQKTDKSNSGANHKHKLSGSDLHETSEEKEAKRLHSKADPTLAMSEAEPAVVAQTAANYSLHAPLRSIQHKDPNGIPIPEPDHSNPTRSRWERPLDTIRGFEAAIDGGYNRKSMYRADTDLVANWNRRSSYFANTGPSRFPRESYYGGRPNRPDSVMFDPRGHAREGEMDMYDAPQPNGARNRYSRMNSEPVLNGRPHPEKGVYPIPNNHRSNETVTTGSGQSGSLGEPSGYQTDITSSENSSIERRSPPKRQEPVNEYGISFGQPQSYLPNAPSRFAPAPQPPQHAPLGPPPVPTKENNGGMLRKGPKAPPVVSSTTAAPDKRKSWFARRFSKQG